MDQNKRGIAALDAGNAAEALVAFTRALVQHPTSPDYYTNRTKAFARLSPPRHDLALKDAEHAVLHAQNRGKRDKIQEAQLRRVVALYSLGRYAEAQKLLTLVGNRENAQMFKMWEAKVAQKLRSLPEAGEIEVHETPNISLPAPSTAEKLLKNQINADGTFNFEVAEGKVDIKQIDTKSEAHESAKDVQSQSSPADAMIRQDWFQTATNVTVTLFAKGVDKDRLQQDIQATSVHISFPKPGSDVEYAWAADPLYAVVDVSKSKITVLKTKVEIVLVKATAGQKWAALEGIETPTAAANKTSNTTAPVTATKEAAPSYPTSSRSGAKNWDKVAADLSKKPKKESTREPNSGESEPEDQGGNDSDIEGGDDVDNFFKKLYKGSDPDTQRAMMKSYYESGGTTLSTNWADVGSKKVEPYQSKDD